MNSLKAQCLPKHSLIADYTEDLRLCLWGACRRTVALWESEVLILGHGFLNPSALPIYHYVAHFGPRMGNLVCQEVSPKNVTALNPVPPGAASESTERRLQAAMQAGARLKHSSGVSRRP